jgi:hypothetical protein
LFKHLSVPIYTFFVFVFILPPGAYLYCVLGRFIAEAQQLKNNTGPGGDVHVEKHFTNKLKKEVQYHFFVDWFDRVFGKFSAWGWGLRKQHANDFRNFFTNPTKKMYVPTYATFFGRPSLLGVVLK